MKATGFMFSVLAGFFAIVSVVYWFWSKDPTGTTALVLTFGLCVLIGYYVLYTIRRVPPQPEDRSDADISDGAGELGFFSPHSWWPIAVAAGFSVFALGLIFGVWLSLIGVAILATAASGFLFEYYVGRE